MSKRHWNKREQEIRKDTLKQVLEIINKDIKIQTNMIKNCPQHSKSSKWRIIGMEQLKVQLGGEQKHEI